jgi:hypothetical protein
MNDPQSTPSPRPREQMPAEVLESGTVRRYPEEPPPARMIQIVPLAYGYQVVVGCQSFAFETAGKLIKKLAVYLDDPDGTETLWLKKELDMN